MEVWLPLRTWSEPNLRTHWAPRARRVRQQRGAARLLVRAAFAAHGRPATPRSVALTRIAPRALDSDNLAAALKAVRDGVADALGMDDGDPRLIWRYDQGRGRPKEYAIVVEVS